ncbi:Glycoside hydrolase, 10, partial [Colletotrichum noveboracense]
MYAKTLLVLMLGSGLASAQLNTLAVRAGLKYFGTAVNEQRVTDTTYMAIVNNTAEFGSVVPENGQKWAYTEPSQNTFSYTSGDIHYLGQCYAWDVVNEAAADDGTWRASVFYNTLGTDYLPISFRAARAADPNTKLYLNDYNLEYNGAKTDRVYEAATIVQNAGAPIDGVGFQGHLIVGSTPGRSALATALRRFTALGLEVAYTELDIRHSSLPASSAALVTQGNDFANVVGSCVDVDGCVGVTIWGFTDKYSWIPDTFSGQGDALLWDANYAKKPAYTSVSSVLAAAATGGAGTTVPTTTTTRTSTLVTSTTSSRATTTTAASGSEQVRWGQCG